MSSQSSVELDVQMQISDESSAVQSSKPDENIGQKSASNSRAPSPSSLPPKPSASGPRRVLSKLDREHLSTVISHGLATSAEMADALGTSRFTINRQLIDKFSKRGIRKFLDRNQHLRTATISVGQGTLPIHSLKKELSERSTDTMEDSDSSLSSDASFDGFDDIVDDDSPCADVHSFYLDASKDSTLEEDLKILLQRVREQHLALVQAAESMNLFLDVFVYRTDDKMPEATTVPAVRPVSGSPDSPTNVILLALTAHFHVSLDSKLYRVCLGCKPVSPLSSVPRGRLLTSKQLFSFLNDCLVAWAIEPYKIHRVQAMTASRAMTEFFFRAWKREGEREGEKGVHANFLLVESEFARMCGRAGVATVGNFTHLVVVLVAAVFDTVPKTVMSRLFAAFWRMNHFVSTIRQLDPVDVCEQFPDAGEGEAAIFGKNVEPTDWAIEGEGEVEWFTMCPVVANWVNYRDLLESVAGRFLDGANKEESRRERERDWVLLDETFVVLRQFACYADVLSPDMQDEMVHTVAEIVPAFASMFIRVRESRKHAPEAVIPIVDALAVYVERITDRLLNPFAKDFDATYLTATTFHPQYKRLMVASQLKVIEGTICNEARRRLLEKARATKAERTMFYDDDETDLAPDAAEVAAIDELMREVRASFRRYVNEDFGGPTRLTQVGLFDCIGFWARNRWGYSEMLCEMAIAYLSIPMTSGWPV